jgi:hypothetical protein
MFPLLAEEIEYMMNLKVMGDETRAYIVSVEVATKI